MVYSLAFLVSIHAHLYYNLLIFITRVVRIRENYTFPVIVWLFKRFILIYCSYTQHIHMFSEIMNSVLFAQNLFGFKGLI